MKKVIVILLIGITVYAKGQDIEKPAVRPLLTKQKNAFENANGDDDMGYLPGFEHKKAFTVFAGTGGVGADFRYGFLPRLSVRMGAGTTPVNVPNAFTINDFSSQINLDVNFTNVHLLADFQPFGGSGFRVAFGVGFFVKGNTTANITPTQDSKYGNITLTPQQLGTMQITANWQGLAPYLGLGFGRTFARGLFNVTLDLGSYYLAAPQITIVATGALQPNEDNSQQLQENISNYRWLPVLQLNFNFRL